MPNPSEHGDESTVQRVELRERAEQLEAAGDREQALTVYEQLAALDRRDSMPLLKIGDLRLKLEHFAEAVAAYGRAGECYRREGAHLKALAVFTQMRALIRRRARHLEPRYADLPLRLAETHAALGQKDEAARLYGEVVGALVASGQAREALRVVDQMMGLDRQSPTAHLLRADCHAKLGEIDKAVASAGAAAEVLVSRSKLDEAIAVLERLLEYWPDPAYARVTARVYLARGQAGDAVAALQKLQICFAADPTDVATLELLATAFEAMEQPRRANRVLEEAARTAQSAGRSADYQRLARKLLDRDPQNPVALAFAEQLGSPLPERRSFTDAEAEWGMRQLEEEITSVGRLPLQREASSSRDDLDSGLLALEEDITEVLFDRRNRRAPSVDEEALWRADGLAVQGRFDEAAAILDGQDPNHPLVRDVRERVAEAEQLATDGDGRASLHSLYPDADRDRSSQSDDTAVFTRGAAASAASASGDAPAVAEVPQREGAEEAAPAPPRPARRRRRAALSGAISRKRPRKRR